ncbi:hypothetical protein CWI42_051340 [Ordospora colligata]|uniref:Uncharacterized protein n=1 Tax=Ordospora colligata OC4 TaxID=1354746 RepID=A0A0B2UL77_9MICR|nr:uncharacterized protein M896_051390 [Ordospora colligata OC4]KHN69730.1 hypothetical protein M896_051390 [Ordospora colligata OC4]TBU15696.1 hypothetical protein CWI40_051370 [Ordospora colligata]TBU18651.1 hypothetical protein CWI42_051340 [Ordospora colligata]
MLKDPNILAKLKRYNDVSIEIDNRARALDSLMSKLNLDIIDEFKSYIEPKKGIDKLLMFYNMFMQSKAVINQEKSSLEEQFGGMNNASFTCKLETLKENDVMGSIQRLMDVRQNLVEYNGVIVVEVEVISLDEIIKGAIGVVEESFFASLSKIPKLEPEIQEFAVFLLAHVDRKRTISRYTDMMYSKFGFDGVGSDNNMLLERTSRLSHTLLEIADINDSVIGKEHPEVTIGLQKMLVIGLRREIIDNLMRMEKEEGISSIPFLVELNSKLRHSGNRRTRAMEELFVFKDRINQVICNCMSRYFEDLDMVMNANSKCDAESLCVDMRSILDSFYDHKDILEVFVKTYGMSFGLTEPQDMFQVFSGKSMEKILLLAETLKGISKSVYVLNNAHVFDGHLKHVDNISIEQIVSINIDDIVNVWKHELEKRSEEDITVFLDKNIESQNRHFVPEAYRTNIVEQIDTIVNKALSTKKYMGNTTKLYHQIKKLYSQPHT